MSRIQTLLGHREEKEGRDTDTYIGVVSPISTPFNLYAKLDDLYGDNISFVGFSVGKRYIISFGTYVYSERTFYIWDACNGKLKMISPLMRDLNQRDFTSISNVTKDNIIRVLGSMSNGPPPIIDDQDYLRLKYSIAYYDAEKRRRDNPGAPGITWEEYINKFPELKNLDLITGQETTVYDWFMNQFYTQYNMTPLDERENPLYDYDLEEFVNKQRQIIDKYEKLVNRRDINRDTPRVLSQKLITMTEDFYKVINEKGWARGSNLEDCPENCKKGDQRSLCGLYTVGDTYELA